MVSKINTYRIDAVMSPNSGIKHFLMNFQDKMANDCRTHNSAKSKKINKLVDMSYDMGAMISDGDAVFLEKVIDQEKNLELKEALKELDEFLCE